MSLQPIFFGAGLLTVKLSSAGEWVGATSDFTFSGANITINDATGPAIRSNDTFPGDFSFQFQAAGTTRSDYKRLVFGVYDVAENATFSQTAETGNMAAMTNSYFIDGDNARTALYYGNAEQTSDTHTNDDILKMERIGTQLKSYLDGALVHTWSQTVNQELRMVMSRWDANNPIVKDLTWTF